MTDTIIKSPAEYDINIYRDRDFLLKVTTDLVGSVDFEGGLWDSSGTILETFVITEYTGDGYIELSLDSDTTNNLINELTLTLGSINTYRNLYWDLSIINTSGTKYSLIEGNCRVKRTVSKNT